MEEIKEPIKISVDLTDKIIIVSKDYHEVTLTVQDCKVIETLYVNFLKEKEI